MVDGTAAPIVDIRNVTRRFGDKVALDNISPHGSQVACPCRLVGENGAGENHSDQARPRPSPRRSRDPVRVFGRDPVADPRGGTVAYRLSVGRVRTFPSWMRVRADLMRATRRPSYPTLG